MNLIFFFIYKKKNPLWVGLKNSRPQRNHSFGVPRLNQGRIHNGTYNIYCFNVTLLSLFYCFNTTSLLFILIVYCLLNDFENETFGQ